jgi:ABC-type multidrug transport system fused ATPase/permease subunit
MRLQAHLQGKARSTQYRGERLWAIIENFQSLIATCGRVSVIILGAWFVISRRATVGEFVLFLALQDMAYQPVCQLSILFPRLRRAMSRVDRLFRVLDQRPEIADPPGAPALERLEHSIEFCNVWFRYSEDQPWVLKDVSVVVPAGTSVALVGRSGSGKTTFVNLLQRLYDPDHGRIRIDGVDIRQVSQESLRAQIAVVPQEVDLFSRTVAQNIAYGKPGSTAEEIEAAARLALAHEFILRTEDGYETLVGERGMKLSGGERQRIGIARAVLRNPRILILDEATSHLDTESERLIQSATDRVVQGRTSFLIAHRLSTVLKADMVIVFNQQGIEAIGTHEELRLTSPTYHKLYALHEKTARDAVPATAAEELEVVIRT